MKDDTVVTKGRHPASRRQVLHGIALAGLGMVAGGAGVLDAAWPAAAAVPASGWPQQAFAQKSEAAALKALYGLAAEPSDKVALDVPEIAENGAVVPVSLTTSLPDVSAISFLVSGNPFTLAASYRLSPGTEADVSCRLKMAKTSDVIALVLAGGKLYSTRKQVKVTLGGCGG